MNLPHARPMTDVARARNRREARLAVGEAIVFTVGLLGILLVLAIFSPAAPVPA